MYSQQEGALDNGSGTFKVSDVHSKPWLHKDKWRYVVLRAALNLPETVHRVETEMGR